MVDGREFLRFAAALLSVNGDEAVARTAVGRACRAVYHIGRCLVESGGGHVSRGPAGHKQLADLLGRDDEILVGALDRLRRFRNAADYDAELAIDATTMATDAEDIAAELISVIDELSTERV